MNLRQRRVAASPVSPEPQEMARNAAEPLSTKRDPWAQRNSASTEAFGAAVVNFVIVTPMVLWGVVLLAGTATYAGPGAAKNAHLPLAWYDAFFVRFGPLFFMLPLALRAFSDKQNVAAETSLPTPARAFVVYTIVGLVRLAVYLLGLALGSRAMSDHLFLGATVVASAQGEAIACAATALRLMATAKAGGGGGLAGQALARDAGGDRGDATGDRDARAAVRGRVRHGGVLPPATGNDRRVGDGVRAVPVDRARRKRRPRFAKPGRRRRRARVETYARECH